MHQTYSTTSNMHVASIRIAMQLHFLVPESPTVPQNSCTGTGAYIAIANEHIGFCKNCKRKCSSTVQYLKVLRQHTTSVLVPMRILQQLLHTLVFCKNCKRKCSSTVQYLKVLWQHTLQCTDTCRTSTTPTTKGTIAWRRSSSRPLALWSMGRGATFGTPNRGWAYERHCLSLSSHVNQLTMTSETYVSDK